MEDKTLNFGTEEIKEKLSKMSNFAKFERNKIYKVEILSSEIKPRMTEYKDQPSLKYDISVLIDEKEKKTWGVSASVLKTINEYWDKTRKFNVMLGEKSYSVIPILKNN